MNFKLPYQALLRLYPADHQVLFAAEMLTTFEDAAADLRARGGLWVFRFAIAEFIGLGSDVCSEWIGKFAYDLYRWANLIKHASLAAELIAKLTYACFHLHGSFMSRYAPDFRMMRPLWISRQLWWHGRPARVACARCLTT